MIIVHTYCSYKLSPSGFQYGTFVVKTDENEDMYYLSDDRTDNIVSSAFDYSIIKRLKGRIPDKNTFVYLFKKILHTYDTDHDDFGGDVSINMAFEFDDYDQFVSFLGAFEDSEDNSPVKLAKSLADCIFPNISITKFKLSIRKQLFDTWLKTMVTQPPSNDNEKLRLKKRLCIITDSCEKDLYTCELQQIFNFKNHNNNGDELRIKHLKDTPNYIYPIIKEKKQRLDIKRYSDESGIKKLEDTSKHVYTTKKKEKKQYLILKMKPHLFLKILAIVLLVMLMILIAKNSNSDSDRQEELQISCFIDEKVITYNYIL